MYFCDQAEFSASFLQSSVSHDPPEIIIIYWFAVHETFLIIMNVENSCAASYFCVFSFLEESMMKSNLKEQHRLEIKIFSNNIKVTFDQWNEHSFSKNKNVTDPNFLKASVSKSLYLLFNQSHKCQGETPKLDINEISFLIFLFYVKL